jgi:hypothetical protein
MYVLLLSALDFVSSLIKVCVHPAAVLGRTFTRFAD